MQFGETVQGYDIPVLNEREIRASAGILFLVMFLSLMFIVFKQNFLLIKYVIVLFLADFVLRVFISPRLSPTLIIGRWIVHWQNPEYVGAPQKKFAWMIGLSLATLMFVLMVVVNSYSIITGLSCLACLIFLFFESAFGICLGCLIYSKVFKGKAQYCPGEICNAKDKQDIQKISLPQVGIVIGFIALVLITAYLFNDDFSETPTELWAIVSSMR